jgi:stearoyl-CoA desaturase (delta-9 desaturase)
MEGREHRWFILGASVIPLVAVFGAMALLWNRIFHWSDLVVLVIMYAISGFGISAGYHRMLTHRSFETYKPIRVALATAGVMAGQGPPLIWAAHHPSPTRTCRSVSGPSTAGRVATAKFFAQETLPLLAAQRAIATREDTVLMDLADTDW